MQWIPSAENVAQIHQELVHLFEKQDDPISPSGVKSTDLLESACNRPLTALGKTEKYPTIVQKLAALFHSLTKNHAFHNGNKRTALVSLLTAMYRNDLRLRNKVTDSDVYDLVIAVSEDKFPKPESNSDEIVNALASWIRENSENARAHIGSMKVKDFVEKCELAGAKSKHSKGSTLIVNGQQSIRISGSTQQISGPVVVAWLKRLRLSPNQSGIDLFDFQSGANPERQQVYRFMSTLRKLAKT